MSVLLTDPLLHWMLGFIILCCFIYMIFAALFETADKHRVVMSAKAWQEAKKRENQRDRVARELWDSVASLKRGHRLSIDDVSKIPAIHRKNNARMGGRSEVFETSKY